MILLSLINARPALPLLRGVTKSADERLHQEVQEAWRRKAEAAIAAAVVDSNAAQESLATELKHD